MVTRIKRLNLLSRDTAEIKMFQDVPTVTTPSKIKKKKTVLPRDIL